MIKFLHVMLTVTAYVSLVLGCSNVSDSFCIEQDTDSTFVYCSHGRQGRVDLMRDSLYRIYHYVADSLVDVWAIRDSVYQFDCGDLDNDSVPEILVGVICSTRFRPELDKRLYIFKLCKFI